MSTAIRDKLETIGSEAPEHLQQASKDAADAIRKRMDAKKEERDAEAEASDPKAEEKYLFEFAWRDARGKLWKGNFTNRVLTHADRQVVGALQSEWQLGRPHSSFDPDVSAMNFMLAHMTVTLDGDAEWAKDLRRLHSSELIQKLYEEVASHEATFHGHSAHQEASKADR